MIYVIPRLMTYDTCDEASVNSKAMQYSGQFAQVILSLN